MSDVFDPLAETEVDVGDGVGVGVDAVVAAVLEVVSVLDVPPLTVGVTLN